MPTDRPTDQSRKLSRCVSCGGYYDLVTGDVVVTVVVVGLGMFLFFCWNSPPLFPPLSEPLAYYASTCTPLSVVSVENTFLRRRLNPDSWPSARQEGVGGHDQNGTMNWYKYRTCAYRLCVCWFSINISLSPQRIKHAVGVIGQKQHIYWCLGKVGGVQIKIIQMVNWITPYGYTIMGVPFCLSQVAFGCWLAQRVIVNYVGR